jgi:hypothetical protein
MSLNGCDLVGAGGSFHGRKSIGEKSGEFEARKEEYVRDFGDLGSS